MVAVMEVVERARQVVADLGTALDAELSTLPDEVLDALVPVVGRLVDGVEGARSVVVGEWEARGRFRGDGSRSARARLARDAGCSSAGAGVVVRRGRFLRRFPQVGAALREGSVTPDKVDVLARAAIPVRAGLFGEAVEGLLSDAKRLGCGDLARVVAFWCDAADDHLGRDRSRGRWEGRRLSFADGVDGSVLVEGRLDPVAGAIVTGELDRICQELFEEDWALARAEFGAEASVDRLPRSAVQRRADGLRVMAERSAAPPVGARVPRPLFAVIVDRETCQRVCELADGTPVSPAALAPWVTRAEVERAIFAGPARVLEVGRRTRFFRGGLRRAIELRDRHCTFPGCMVPAERCEVDHVVEYVDGGPTTQANGRLRCPAHNRQRPGRRPPDPPGRAGPPDDPPGPR